MEGELLNDAFTQARSTPQYDQGANRQRLSVWSNGKVKAITMVRRALRMDNHKHPAQFNTAYQGTGTGYIVVLALLSYR